MAKDLRVHWNATSTGQPGETLFPKVNRIELLPAGADVPQMMEVWTKQYGGLHGVSHRLLATIVLANVRYWTVVEE